MDTTEQNRLTFLKALIGAAWLDPAVSAEALNTLKIYLRRVNMSEEERFALKSYYARNIRDIEARELVDNYIRLLQTESQERTKSLSGAVADLIELEDSDEPDDEFLSRLPLILVIFRSIDEFLARTRQLFLGGGIAKPIVSSGRSDDLDEFVRNRIMASVRAKMLDMNLVGDNLSARDVAYITSLSAPLGRIAHADDDFSQEEKVEISHLLKESTNLSHGDIDVVMETIADETLTGLDLKSITRTYYNLSNDAQRLELLNCLFLVAGADGQIDQVEVNEIEQIAVGLNLSHRDILRAKANAMEIVRKRLSL